MGPSWLCNSPVGFCKGNSSSRSLSLYKPVQVIGLYSENKLFFLKLNQNIGDQFMDISYCSNYITEKLFPFLSTESKAR